MYIWLLFAILGNLSRAFVPVSPEHVGPNKFVGLRPYFIYRGLEALSQKLLTWFWWWWWRLMIGVVIAEEDKLMTSWNNLKSIHCNAWWPGLVNKGHHDEQIVDEQTFDLISFRTQFLGGFCDFEIAKPTANWISWWGIIQFALTATSDEIV